MFFFCGCLLYIGHFEPQADGGIFVGLDRVKKKSSQARPRVYATCFLAAQNFSPVFKIRFYATFDPFSRIEEVNLNRQCHRPERRVEQKKPLGSWQFLFFLAFLMIEFRSMKSFFLKKFLTLHKRNTFCAILFWRRANFDWVRVLCRHEAVELWCVCAAGHHVFPLRGNVTDAVKTTPGTLCATREEFLRCTFAIWTRRATTAARIPLRIKKFYYEV